VVTVSRVVDGDTIGIAPAVDGLMEVRLIGVDTP
jgi:micrococcal nuclease